MKKSFFIVTGLIFAVSTAFASPSDQMDFTTMSKADSQVLFGHNDMSQQVSILDEQQMHDLQAKGWWSNIVTVAAVVFPIQTVSTAVTALRPDETAAGLTQISTGNVYSGVGTLLGAGYSIYKNPKFKSPTLSGVKRWWTLIK